MNRFWQTIASAFKEGAPESTVASKAQFHYTQPSFPRPARLFCLYSGVWNLTVLTLVRPSIIRKSSGKAQQT